MAINKVPILDENDKLYVEVMPDELAPGAAGGLAQLDSGSRVPDSQLPERLGADALAATFLQGKAVSQDGTSGLPAPAGVGLEFVINAAGLDDIRFNGTSL